MTSLIQYFSALINSNEQTQQANLVCNYQDDYYGDQICAIDIQRVMQQD
jgi:hypothetical protein